jgi:glycosyltransferase involved in cell wall biosynthesis
VVLHSIKAVAPAALHARRTGAALLAVEHQPNQLKSNAEWVASALAPRLADRVVLLTEEYRDALSAGLGRLAGGGRLVVVSNGIDVDAFAPAGPRARSGPRRIGMAGRLTPTKRQDLLIAALAELARRDGAHAWRLTLAGDGPERARLEAMARDLGVAASVEFAGYLDEAALIGWLDGLDVYAQASDGETLSTAVLQAMAARVPCSVSDAPGLSRLGQASGGVARVVASPAPADWADALAATAGDVELAGRAAAHVAAHHGLEAMARGYHDALVAARRRR